MTYGLKNDRRNQINPLFIMFQLKDCICWTEVSTFWTFHCLTEVVQIPYVIFKTRSNIVAKTSLKFKWNFLETLIQSVQRSLNVLFQCTFFLMFPFFQNVSTPGQNQEIGKQCWLPPLILQDQPQGYILSCFFKLVRVLSLSRMLVEFFLACIFHHAWEKFFNSWCSHSQKMH